MNNIVSFTRPLPFTRPFMPRPEVMSICSLLVTLEVSPEELSQSMEVYFDLLHSSEEDDEDGGSPVPS